MIDSLVAHLDKLAPPPCFKALSLRCGAYLVLTLHIPANVDGPIILRTLLASLAKAARDLPVVFPAHPVKHARAVVTDSGGVTEETTYLNIPCFTLRKSTKRPETVVIGMNTLLGTNPANVEPALSVLFSGGTKSGLIPEKWDGRTGEHVAAALAELMKIPHP